MQKRSGPDPVQALVSRRGAKIFALGEHMVNMLRALAATCIVGSGVVLFAFEHHERLFGALLIVGSLLSLAATCRDRREW